MNERKHTDGRSDRTEWTPPKERRVWPWILLIVLVIGVIINVALSVG
ncbi:hypothetical protein [Actinoallomurus sp. NPDC052274]